MTTRHAGAREQRKDNMPRVTEVIVNAGRTFNHPYESYSNLRPSITVKAQIFEEEDWETVAKALQARVEELVEDHKTHMLKSIETLYDLSQKQQEAARLAAIIERSQQELDSLRRDLDNTQALLPEVVDDGIPL